MYSYSHILLDIQVYHLEQYASLVLCAESICCPHIGQEERSRIISGKYAVNDCQAI